MIKLTNICLQTLALNKLFTMGCSCIKSLDNVVSLRVKSVEITRNYYTIPL